MADPFFERPILNSPYECPLRHWELDPQGQPTQQIIECRRRAEFTTPIPKPKKRKGTPAQETFVLDEGRQLSPQKQQYDPTSIKVRGHVDRWRALSSPNLWQVTPETAHLTPGLTIKDRLRVLQPNDPDSYHANRELVPSDMLDDVKRAKIVITNYHAFKLRERIELSAGGRSLLQGRGGQELNTKETEGQMLQRVIPDLMGMKNILPINDEAHHCYREKPEDGEEELKADKRKEAEKNNEAARLWISGLESVNRRLGISCVMDLSATPSFLRGSGYAERTLFPWSMSDFSLWTPSSAGIVTLPRVPVAVNSQRTKGRTMNWQGTAGTIQICGDSDASCKGATIRYSGPL